MTDSFVRAWIQDDHSAPSDVVSAMWLNLAFKSTEPHEARLSVSTKTKARDIKVDGLLLADYSYESDSKRLSHDFLWAANGAFVRVEDTYPGSLRIRVLSDGDVEIPSKILGELREQIRFVRGKKANEVAVKFWRMTSQGGAAFTRNIEAPTWRTIERNYSANASTQLGQLMRLKSKQLGTGKIILLHGPAGTGKTTAIRALAREWKQWCSLSYAVDPEKVFGHGDYLTNLIADQDANDEDIFGGSAPKPLADKWRLLVIEDAEEFLVPDAKHEVGQAVSRLLNVGDGILGQGLKLLVMLTTNVPVNKLSPAITRPGRCLANIEVPEMTKTEASAWLGRDVPSGATLAELWEISHPTQIGTGIADTVAAGQYL